MVGKSTETVSVCKARCKDINQTNDQVIVESLFSIFVETIGQFSVIVTPNNLDAFVVGFLFSEGLIDTIDDILGLKIDELKNQAFVKIEQPERVITNRHLIVTSSCGLCGSKNIEQLKQQIQIISNSLKISCDEIFQLVNIMQDQQMLFRETGAAHCAMIFNSEKKIASLAEDLSRHVALDKSIGKFLLNNNNKKQSFGLVLSGRVSSELIIKAARFGVELIVAVSAPTSYALELAKHWNITLIGFARPPNLNIYFGDWRILKNKFGK